MEKREIVNNIQERPFEHYCALYKALDPEETARRCAVKWDAEAGEFELVFLGNLYRVAFPDFAVRCAERRVPADRLNGLGKGQILLLRHLPRLLLRMLILWLQNRLASKRNALLQNVLVLKQNVPASKLLSTRS